MGLADGPKWLVVMGEEVRTAFCVGLLRPWVVVSAGLLERFGEPGLRAVLEHELSHRRRRDPLRWAVAKSLARGLFFMPSLTDLADVVPAEGEVSADATAARSVGRDALVGALQELLGHPIPAAAAPIAGEDLVMLRLKALETGERPRARLHLGRLAASALVLVALLGAGAWLPRYPRSHVIVLTPHPIAPPPVGRLGSGIGRSRS